MLSMAFVGPVTAIESGQAEKIQFIEKFRKVGTLGDGVPDLSLLEILWGILVYGSLALEVIALVPAAILSAIMIMIDASSTVEIIMGIIMLILSGVVLPIIMHEVGVVRVTLEDLRRGFEDYIEDERDDDDFVPPW